MSLREIASKEGISHVTVRKKLIEDLKYYNNALFLEVEDAIKNNIPKSVKDPEVLKRVLRAYYALVNDNKTYEQIAEDEKVSKFVIHRDLTVRLAKINQIAPETVTLQMVQKASDILNAHSRDNLNVGNQKYTITQNRDASGRFI